MYGRTSIHFSTFQHEDRLKIKGYMKTVGFTLENKPLSGLCHLSIAKSTCPVGDIYTVCPASKIAIGSYDTRSREIPAPVCLVVGSYGNFEHDINPCVCMLAIRSSSKCRAASGVTSSCRRTHLSNLELGCQLT